MHNVVDINGSIHTLNVRTNLPTFSVYDTMTGGPSDVLSKVMIDTNPGGIIYHLPRDNSHKQSV